MKCVHYLIMRIEKFEELLAMVAPYIQRKSIKDSRPPRATLPVVPYPTRADLYHELRLCFNFLKAPAVSRTRPDPRTKSVHVEIERIQRTLSETRTDQRSFSEIRVVRVRAGPVGLV